MILRAPNVLRLVRGKPKTYLDDAAASASGTLTVQSIAGFSVGQMLIVGVLGAERTEMLRVHTSSAPSGTTVTLNANTAQRHEIGAPVFMTDYDQVEFSRATTEAGAKSVLATSTITPDQMETIYDDTTNSTGFGFYRFKNSATSAFSDYSDAIPYAGYALDAVDTIISRALSQASAKVSPRLTYDELYSFVNDYVAYMNSVNIRWSEAKVLNYEVDTIATGDWEFTLPTNISRDNDPTAIMSLQVQGNVPLRYMTQREFRQITLDMIYTTVATTFTDAATEIVLTNSANFADSGTIEIEGDVISYTGNTRSTDTLTGVTGIATGGHVAGTYAFQKHTTSDPIYYTISDAGKIRVWPICGATVNNRVLYADYYRAIPTVDGLGDRTLVSNIKPAADYVAYRIKKHLAGGSLQIADEDYTQFVNEVATVVARDIPSEPLRISVGGTRYPW